MSLASEEIQEALRTIDAHLASAVAANGDHRVFIDEIAEGIKIVQWARIRSEKLRKDSLLTQGIESLISDKERELKSALYRAISEN